jgi:hypothetical protein
MKCNKTQSKWCINKHGAPKITDTFEMYQPRNRHHGTVEVPAVGEGDVGVVDTLVRRPMCLTLLEPHVALMASPWWGRTDGRPSPHVILRSVRKRQLVQKLMGS